MRSTSGAFTKPFFDCLDAIFREGDESVLSDQLTREMMIAILPSIRDALLDPRS